MKMTTVAAAALLAALVAGCGEAWDRYDPPGPGQEESAWHECMRKRMPIHRHQCKDLR